MRTESQGQGDWPMYRGNVRLTGQATLPGNMREPPVVAWQYRIEGGEAWVVVDPTRGKHAQAVRVKREQLEPDYLQSVEGKRWGLGARLVDLHGNGRLVPDPGRAAKLLPDVPGLQAIEFHPAPDSPGLDPKQVVCSAYDSGKKREVWRSDVFDTIQNTNFTLADVDNDGKLEVAFAPHYRVIVLDGQTGRTKHLLRVHGYRNYGFFCCTDLTGDGLLDFVIIADFAMHVDVVKNEGDRLRLLWRRDIEHDIQSKSRVVRPRPNPVFDMNGDGRKEILFNLFNKSGDGKWHVMAYDALTGDTVLDLPASCLSGSADVNGDGVPELFVTRMEALYVPDSAKLSLLSLKGGEASTLWECSHGRWVTAPSILPLTHTTIVAKGTEEVVAASLTSDRKRGFFVVETRADHLERLVAYARSPKERLVERWCLTLPARSRMRMQACADVDGDGVDESLITFRQQSPEASGPWPCTGAAARVVSLRATTVTHESIGAGEFRPVVVARPSRARRPVVVFEGANNDIVAVTPPSQAEAKPQVRWRVPGAGPSVMADVNGDRRPEVVFADWGETGEGDVVVVDAQGKEIWRHRVKDFPGPHPEWNFGGVTTWWVGRYTARSRCDVWVSARRSTMHSDEAWMLRGTDGKELWHLREVRTNRTPKETRGWGAGGSYVCSADVDGDGLEDVIGLYPVNYMAAKGATGELLHSVQASSGLFEGVWGAYCQPMAADLNSDGKEELLWCGPYHHGLTTFDAKVLWYHKGGASVAGLGDVDGDGKLELGFTGWEQGKGLRCLDAATGAEKWEWPLKGNPRVPVYTADIDGNGCDEFLFAHNTTLCSVNGKAGAPNLVWQVELPSAPGNLALADVDGDAKTEILFVGADSVLYCLEGAAGRRVACATSPERKTK